MKGKKKKDKKKGDKVKAFIKKRILGKKKRTAQTDEQHEGAAQKDEGKDKAKGGGKPPKKKKKKQASASEEATAAAEVPTTEQHFYREVNVTRCDTKKVWRYYMSKYVKEKGKKEKVKIRRSWTLAFKNDAAEAYRGLQQAVDYKLDEEGWIP